jgi:hypothetical protein
VAHGDATFAEVSEARKQQHRLVIGRACWSSANEQVIAIN